MKTSIFFLALLCLSTFGHAQTGKFYGLMEDVHHTYICSIDTSNNTFHDLDSIPGATVVNQGVSSCDPVHGRYLFMNLHVFYAIDVRTGKTVKRMPIPEWAGSMQPAYDPKSGNIYAIIPASGYTYFAKIDTANDTIIKINTIPGKPNMVQGAYGINAREGVYYALGIDPTKGNAAYFVDLVTGTTKATIYISHDSNLVDIQYDAVQNRYYGIHQAGNETNYISYFDSNKKLTIVDSIAMGAQGGIIQGVSCYDALHSHYFIDNFGLYSMNSHTAKIDNHMSFHNTGIVDFQYFGPSILLEGKVSASTGNPLKSSRVYLCTYNSSDSVVTITDSTLTDTSGHYSFATFDTSVYVMAMPDIRSYPNELPTWSDSGADFQDGNSITLSIGKNIKNFKTIYGTNPGGTGYIGGKVVFCALCKTEAPAKNIRIILADSNGIAQKYTYTDANGSFVFKNIGISKYKIWVDRPHINNKIAPVISLDASAQTLNNLSFTLYPTYLAYNGISGIEATNAPQNSIVVYPNPAVENSITIEAKDNSANSRLGIMDISGRECMSLAISSAKTILDISTLPKGMYLLRWQTKDKIWNGKFIRE